MGVKALGHRLIVKMKRIERKTAGGIIKPDALIDQEKAAETVGEIIDIGPTCWKNVDTGEPWAEVGDTIVFAKYAGIVVIDPETGEEYYALNDQDVFLKFYENGSQ